MPYYQPPEWQPHRACWTAFPYAGDLWLEDLTQAQAEFLAFCRTVAASEPVYLLVPSDTVAQTVRRVLDESLAVRLLVRPYGDIWLRDTGPIFLRDEKRVIAGCFQFNGWGNKYVIEGDAGVARGIAADAGLTAELFPWVLEGGAVDVDGAGSCLTTRQCLLNENRNATLSPAEIETCLRTALGVHNILWLDQGLHNDHTDGHVDTLARFVGPGEVVCMRPNAGDPNELALTRILDALQCMRAADGTPLRVHTVPSPGAVTHRDGTLLPASYMNFYIGTRCVVVPTYGTPFDAPAVAQIGKLFPSRETIGLSARAILTGGGAFHCMTQQEPF